MERDSRCRPANRALEQGPWLLGYGRPADRSRQGQHGYCAVSSRHLCVGAVRAVASSGRPLSRFDDPPASSIGTPNYPLGTDELGRDMLARLVYGGRLSLVIGILPVVLAFIGTSLGLIAGCTVAKVNTAIMRSVDIPSTRFLGAAGDRDIRRYRWSAKHHQLHRFADRGVRAANHPRCGKCHRTSAQHLDFVEAARASGAAPSL